MRHHISLLLLVVTLALAGCNANTASPWRTPGGGNVSDIPDMGEAQKAPAADRPMPMAQADRAIAPAYYPPVAPKQVARELPPVKVGLLLPLSGAQAELGQAMSNAAQMAIFDVGATNVTMIPRDTATGAAKAAEDAIAQGAQIILGPLFAQDVKAVSPIARRANVPVIAFSTDWTATDQNTYIMGFLPFGQVSRVVDFAAKRGAKKFAGIIPETPYGMAVNGTLKNELQRQNLDSQKTYIFARDPQLVAAVQAISKLQQPGSTETLDAIVVPVGGQQINQVSALMRQNDVGMRQIRLLGTGLWDDSPQAASLLPGGWYAAPDPNLRATFNQKYLETYGKNPPRLTTLAYDASALAAALAIKGLKENGVPAFDRANLINPNGFAGLDGIFRFRPDNLAERGLAILELRPNGSVIVDPAPTRF
jgi:branched-chain amino acid transport system substrate-binding protein